MKSNSSQLHYSQLHYSQLHYAGMGLLGLAFINIVVLMVRIMEATPVVIGFGRLSVAVVGLVVFLRWRKQLQPIERSEVIPLVGIGVLFGLHWVTWFACIQWATAPIAMAAISTYGIFLSVLGWVFLGQSLRSSHGVAVAMVVVGNLLIVPEFSLANAHTMGLLLGIASALFFAGVPVLHQRYRHIPHNTRTLGQFAVGWCFFAALMPFSSWNMGQYDGLFILIMGVLSTLIGHGLWVVASTHLPAVVIACLYYAGVPYVLVLSALFLGETLDGQGMLGMGLIVAANIIVLAKKQAVVPECD